MKRAEEIVKEGKKEIENRNMLKKDEVMIDKVEKKNQKDLIDIELSNRIRLLRSFFLGLFFFDCVKIYFRQRKTKEAIRSVINASTQREK